MTKEKRKEQTQQDKAKEAASKEKRLKAMMERLIASGSAKVNDLQFTDSNYRISDIKDPNLIKLSDGKKRHALIKGISYKNN